MIERRRCTRVIATVLLIAGFLAAGGFLAWRLYNHFSFEKIGLSTKTVWEALKEQPQNPYSYNPEDRVISVSLSEETFLLALGEACQTERVLAVRELTDKEVSFVVKPNRQEKLLLYADCVWHKSGNRITLELNNLSLGSSRLGYNLSKLSRELRTLVFDFSGLIPEWTSLTECRLTEEGAILSLNVALHDFRDCLRGYLGAGSPLYMELGGFSDEALAYNADSQKMTVSQELAEEVLSALFEEGPVREKVCSVVAAFSEEKYQAVMALFDRYFTQSPLAGKTAACRLSYKEKACRFTAEYYLSLLNQSFAGKTMHAGVFYPYDAADGKIYDKDWISANMPQNSLYGDYWKARLYYDEAVGRPAVLIPIPCEEKVFYFDGESQKILTQKDLKKYPLWDAESEKAVRVKNVSGEEPVGELIKALCEWHRADRVYLRYWSQTSSEIFAVFTVDEAVALHGAYFIKTAGRWCLEEAEVGDYASFALKHPEANFSLFPAENYFGLGLSRIANNDLLQVTDGLKADGLLAEDDYFTYFSCYNFNFYYESYLGKRGLVALNGAAEPSVFAMLLEGIHE